MTQDERLLTPEYDSGQKCELCEVYKEVNKGLLETVLVKKDMKQKRFLLWGIAWPLYSIQLIFLINAAFANDVRLVHMFGVLTPTVFLALWAAEL